MGGSCSAHEEINAYRILVGKPEALRVLGWWEDIEMDLTEWGRKVWRWFNWLRIGPVEACCEHSNEPSSSIKDWDFH
jgi:hypothetical protein